MNVACGYLYSHKLIRLLIDSQMNFAPGPPPATAMLLDMPFPCSVDTKPGGINDNMTGPAI
jgi:hypothetical protein